MPATLNNPFAYCANGHDLTGPDSYIYRNGGARDCRQCSIADRGNAGTRTGWKT